jgi:membrane fusion protein, heavy metal efflux system
MRINAWVAACGAAVIFAAGAVTTYLWHARATQQSPQSTVTAPAGNASASAANAAAVPDVVTISSDLLQRAGIVTEVVAAPGGASQLRVPGTVQPNAYRKVSVTPLVGGRVTRVLVELGQPVSRGAVLAEVYSPEIAEVRSRFIAAGADMEAGEAKLRRTERLAALGSASQQELDAVRAEHLRHEIEVREAGSRLRLFGIDPAHAAHADASGDAAASVLRVTAPQGGVVIERPATAGMSAEPSTPLVTIADISPVWVIAEVYERDIAHVSAGAAATLTTDAYPGETFHGRVTYLSPEVRPETRTTQIRVEVPNPGGRLRFGMFVAVSLGVAANPEGITIPAGALQTIGADTVVFVPEQSNPNGFRERRVTVAAASGDTAVITAGLERGERIVTRGSFALRAEAERLGVQPSAAPAAITVRITAAGFEPNTIAVKPGVPLRLTFVRTTDDTCAKDVVLVDYGIRRELPLNTPVTVEFTPRKGFVFQCGMKMLSGTLTIR